MVDRKDVASWLEGPYVPRGTDAGGFAGARLGLPQDGRGAVARFGRRAAALLLDWLLAQLIAMGVLDYRWGSGGWSSFLPLVVFWVMTVLLVGTVAGTIGHRALGLQVVRVGDGRAPGPWPALVRTTLLTLAIPALIWDRDERGLHDKAAGTVLVRTR